MFGLMQDWPLTLDRIIDHAAARHGAREVVTRSLEGPVERTTLAAIRARARRVSSALAGLGIGPGDRVGTLAFNTARHLEAWYGIMGIGAVCHTLNPRLHPDRLCWIANHASDRVLLVDPPFLDLVLARLDRMPDVRAVVVLAESCARADAPIPVVAFERWLEEAGDGCRWGGFDERTAAGLCYTSGTTGDPKGVLYSHRSNFLHTLMTLQRDVMGISGDDTVLAVVPMFHANGWGLPFSVPAIGARLVLPGARLDGASVHALLEQEAVTFSAAVPTVWQTLLAHLEATGGRLSTLRRVVIGGAACPDAMIRAFAERHDVEVIPAWGMTETSPLGTVSRLTAEQRAWPIERRLPVRRRQGRAPLGIEMRITDDAGVRLPEDGVASGHLAVRGCIVAAAYFGRDDAILDADGFFDTGDVATIDADESMQITDRAKDVIKSGGEWISSVEIENRACDHPDVLLAGVIGIAHPKWGERPLLVAQRRSDARVTGPELLDSLRDGIAAWWVPDAVVFVDALPLGATGKVDKKRLRAMFAADPAGAPVGGAEAPEPGPGPG